MIWYRVGAVSSWPAVAALVLQGMLGCAPPAVTADPGVRRSPMGIPGFTGVTAAVEATGSGKRYDVGGGHNDASELDEVPWQSLGPGDVVNIYYRAEPYRHKILLSEPGTKEHPIVINGVTNAQGNRPTLNAANAVTVNPEEWNPAYAGTLLLLNRRKETGKYGVNAAHYRIQNLRLTGVRARNRYTHEGKTRHYEKWNRAIWSAGGQYVVLQGMVIENNGAGVFLQASDDPGSLSKTWTIRGCKFENNGNGGRDHQIYFQAVSEPDEYNIVEGNYFGPPTPGQSSVANLKIRATGAVVRYNWFNSSHRTLDIVEAQDAIPKWMYAHYTKQQILDMYRSSYVYGNIFVNDHNASSGQPSTRPLHFGADSFDEPPVFYKNAGAAAGKPGMRGYQSPTYFFHNTVYTSADSSDLWRGNLFDAENNNSPGPTSTPGSIVAWNNIIEFDGDVRIGIMNRSGTTNFAGANLIYSKTLTTLAESDAFAKTENAGDDPNVTINYVGTIIRESAKLADPGNKNLRAKKFNLKPGSPAIGKAAPLPPALARFPVRMQPAGINGGAVLRSTTRDLGALESRTGS